MNRGMQIRRSVGFFGPIRQSDIIFAKIWMRSTEVLFLRDIGVQKCSQQLRKFSRIGSIATKLEIGVLVRTIQL